MLIGVFVFLDKFGDSIEEIYLGLRELGKLRRERSN